IVLWYLDSGCSKHMTRNRSQLMNFVSKFLGTVRFENNNIARIMGYGDYQLGNVTISRVYYVEGLGHNLFLVGQFCDADLEVAFQKNTCFILNLEGVDLISGSRDTNLYIISLDDMLKTSLICLLSKASKTKSWLWHRRLSHLNFACALVKSKKSSHQPKTEDTNQEKLYLLHMDLCGPMRVASINGNRTKDEAPEAIIKCIKNIQIRLNATVRNVRTDNGTEFVNQTLREFYENISISHQTSVACTPQHNGVVEESKTEHFKKLSYKCFEESPKTPIFRDDPLNESPHEESTSQGSSSNMIQTHTPFEHLGKWTENHPITNVIGDPSRSVSTRKQLQTDTMWCYFDAFLTSIEPKNFKQAMTEPSWIDAMQEEIHEFQRLEVWELVSSQHKRSTFLNQKDLLIRTTHHSVQAQKCPQWSQTSTTCMVRHDVKLPNLTSVLQRIQKFEDLPLEHNILSFIRDLGNTGDINYLTDVNVDYLHQPWRAFSTVINKFLSGKDTGMDKIPLSRAQNSLGHVS
ncbi:retrovirus-related pol polyprotein from transposon TNT 1-94, partial [Tanacetum coccineum]